VKDDGRSRRVALVSDAVLNPPPDGPDVIGAVTDAGWGVIALPPPSLPAAATRAWAAGAADQARELARHGMTIVAVLDAADGAGRAALTDALAADPPLAVPSLVSAGDDLNAVGEFLAAHARG
jgi:hypothetical protein